MPRYTYEVVTSNGSGVHVELDLCHHARAAMERIARNWSIPDCVFEIQRVRHLAGGSRQYDMRQRSRWVPWDCKRDHTVREPDWSATSTGREAGGKDQ